MTELTKQDFASDQETRWCPGCGDYAVLKAVQSFLPDLGLRRENIVFVSGIGCSSRFPYYLDTYGMHSIHGRAPSIATGIATAREDLSVWVVTGDGDALSIGGNHLIHALRRNVNFKILMFNNQIYGLTKGQASPTSDQGFVTPTTPWGAMLPPEHPLALAVACDCSFVARGFAGDGEHLAGLIAKAIRHPGFALVDILQPCVTFNKVNTYQWYKERVYKLPEDYDPSDRQAALAKALEWGERIPIGVIYQSDRPALETKLPQIGEETLVKQKIDLKKRVELVEEFR